MIAAAPRVHYSAASVWELSIKQLLGKLKITADLVELLRASGLQELPITGRHPQAIAAIDITHRGPFDRLLLSQALAENLEFLTADHKIEDLNLS